MSEYAEALYEEIGGDLCICQRHDVPHWCERCQSRIQTIDEAFRRHVERQAVNAGATPPVAIRAESAQDSSSSLPERPETAGRPQQTALAIETWHEDDGDVIWWLFPICEPPYVGSPLCQDWPFTEADELTLGWMQEPDVLYEAADILKAMAGETPPTQEETPRAWSAEWDDALMTGRATPSEPGERETTPLRASDEE